MRRAHRLTQQDQRGSVMVEFAMILPLLLIFFVGIVDFGFIIREHQILQNAAREGARISTLQTYSGNTAAVQNRVVQYLQQENITILAADVTVDQNYVIDIGGGSAKASRITVAYSRSMLVGSGWPFGPVALKAETVFRNLY